MRPPPTPATALAALACLAAAYAQTPPASDQPAAVVNGAVITVAQIEAEVRKRPPVVTPLTLTQQRALRREVLNGLIDELLLRQFLAAQAPTVEEPEIARHLAGLAAVQAARGKTMADYYRETGQTEAQVRAAVTQLVQLDAWAKARCTPEALRKYHQDNKEFFDKVKVHVRHLVLSVPPGAPPAEKEATRQKLRELRTAIAAGRLDFAEAARQNSQCPSGARGGDLGFILRKWMVDEAFARAAFALKPGELSDVVESEVGLHLIQVLERQPGMPTTFEQAEPDVRDCYTEELRQGLLTQLRQTARIEVKLP
jgi:parvulin-like peptidyl-prolyl isomerase